MQSRLTRSAEKKTKNQLFLSLVGIVVLLFVLFKFGIPALTNLSLYLSSTNKSTNQQDTARSKTFLSAPILNQPYTATNSASITVTGTATSKTVVELYMNDSLVDTQTVKDDGTFSFSGVNLTQQQNTIKAKAKLDKTTSDFSDNWNLAYIQKAPSLSIDSPSDGQAFSHDQGSLAVKGKTDPDVRITVNGLWAIVDSQGNYSYTLSLQNGDNHITVIATDTAGNTTTKNITVKYSQ